MLTALIIITTFALLVPLTLGIGLLWIVRDERHAMAAERASWASERQMLLQRVQAPEQAVIDHSYRDLKPSAPDPVLTDEQHWDNAGLQIDKDALAEQVYMSELS